MILDVLFAKVGVIWFDTLVSDVTLALLHVLHINWVSGQTFGLTGDFGVRER